MQFMMQFHHVQLAHTGSLLHSHAVCYAVVAINTYILGRVDR